MTRRLILPALIALIALGACNRGTDDSAATEPSAPETPVVAAQDAKNPAVPPGIESAPPRTTVRKPARAIGDSARGEEVNSGAQASDRTSPNDAPVDFGTDDNGDAGSMSRDDEAGFDAEGQAEHSGDPRDADVYAVDWEGIDGFEFGSEVDEFRERWDGPLEGDDNGECFYLSEARDHPALMFEEGRFVRFDVDSRHLRAPGGGQVGMDASEILELYGDAVERRPHKYVDGEYLRIQHPEGDRVLLFETDERDVVSAWRIGVAPQIDYVEGCS